MRILIVGSGGREHALAWKVAQSPKVGKIFCAPGNGGLAHTGECVDIKATDIPALLAFAGDKGIDLAIIGPESPLILGIADEFRAAGIPTFGPSKAAAAIEGSKVFAKELMAKYAIPSAEFRVFGDPDQASACIERISGGSSECPIVVKADGEALGKGVFVCSTKDEALRAVESIMVDRVFGKAGDRLVIEERLEGQEASLMVITDGESIVPLMPVQDYKRIYDGDRGPNTGGMGCYSPVSVVTPDLRDQVLDTIIKPTVRAMKSEGCPYTGVLYAGIILTANGPRTLEFNARFGDPETQAALPLLETDLVEIIQASLAGSLDSLEVKCYNRCAVCVVVASGGYPGHYETGKPISGLEEAGAVEGVTVFHAGTKLQDGGVVTSGGRVLGVTAVGDTFKAAIERAYSAVEKVHFENMYYRKDIGARAIRDT
ncbi:MAG TPA: phosphoribosylamine--glycine ligase [Armatimonadota bacterium]|nr:phosphoribosylamine--glycine ligase [Armatimonadota bacterium]